MADIGRISAIAEALNDRQKSWFARAMVGMVFADGRVDKEEMDFLREAISFLKKGEAEQILAAAKKAKGVLPLDVLRTDGQRPLAFLLLESLGHIAIADGVFAKSEAVYLIFSASKLGFEKDFVKKDVIPFLQAQKNGLSAAEGKVKREQLVDKVKTMPPVYQTHSGN